MAQAQQSKHFFREVNQLTNCYLSLHIIFMA